MIILWNYSKLWLNYIFYYAIVAKICCKGTDMVPRMTVLLFAHNQRVCVFRDIIANFLKSIKFKNLVLFSSETDVNKSGKCQLSRLLILLCRMSWHVIVSCISININIIYFIYFLYLFSCCKHIYRSMSGINYCSIKIWVCVLFWYSIVPSHRCCLIGLTVI